MYYDRSLDPTLAATLMPGGALTWLMEHVRSAEGRDLHAHLQFRRNRRERRHSGNQLYWGRTSPLEFLLQAGGRVKLTADDTYREGNENLFSNRIPVPEIRLRPDAAPPIETRCRVHGGRFGGTCLGASVPVWPNSSKKLLCCRLLGRRMAEAPPAVATAAVARECRFHRCPCRSVPVR